MTFAAMLEHMRSAFPSVSMENCRPTSPHDEDYNCIAWAADDSSRWWWPDANGQLYWPQSVPRRETLDAFIAAYAQLGYVDVSNDHVEPDRQKIAIFTLNGTPTHAARQLPDGWWASKLGKSIDIEHEFRALDGPTYGTATVVLARATIR